MISNIRLQNAYRGTNSVSRMMLGSELVWPQAPTLIFEIEGGANRFDIEIRTPAPFLIFQEVGGGAYLFSAVKNNTNKTLRTEARSTEGLYIKDHIAPSNSNVLYDIPIDASFVASVSVQLRVVGSKSSRPDRYTGYTDRNTGTISVIGKNEYNIDISFRVEVTNSSGANIVTTVLELPANSEVGGFFGDRIASGLSAGSYTVKLLNLVNSVNYEQVIEIKASTGRVLSNNYTVVTGALEGNIETSNFPSKKVMVYPTTRDKAYKAFYGDVAVIEILALNMVGYDYSSYLPYPAASTERNSSCLVLAKLLAGGSGYRPNAFYPVFWEENRTEPLADGDQRDEDAPYEPFRGVARGPLIQQIVPVFVALTDSNGSVYNIVEYDEQKYGYRLYNDRTSGAGMHWLHFHSTYTRDLTIRFSYGGAWSKGGDRYFSYSSSRIASPYAPQYVTYLDPATGSHVTDSAWVGLNIRNDAGQISTETKTLTDPFSAKGGADVVAVLANIGNSSISPFDGVKVSEYTDAPITFHTLDPEEEWFQLPNNASFGGYRYPYTGNLNRWYPGIGIYPLSADENGLPVIIKDGKGTTRATSRTSSLLPIDGLTNMYTEFDNPLTWDEGNAFTPYYQKGINVNLGYDRIENDPPKTGWAMDPSQYDGSGSMTMTYYKAPYSGRTFAWFFPNASPDYDTSDMITNADGSLTAPWRQSLGPGGIGVGSPVYGLVNWRAIQSVGMTQSGTRFGYYNREAGLTYDIVPLRVRFGGNLSKKSIEFVNYTGNGGPFGQPAGFIPNTLEGDSEVEPVTMVNFNDTSVKGVTAIAQSPLKLLRGSDFTQTANAAGGIDSKLDFTPNNLDSVYSKDIAFTDVNEYCVLEIGAVIPYGCMEGISSKLNKHPGDPLNPTCLSVAGTGDANFSLYTFYIRLKAKGTGYPPNSKIPVYIRRGKDHLPYYNQGSLPANPGPTLEIGQVSNITVDGRGSGGPCVCMIHTDDDGVTTHITEYVDPKSKCRSEGASSLYPSKSLPAGLDPDVEDFTADVNDGANYDGSKSPPMTHPDGSGEWYNERPSQYRRLMNLGEVSDSLYGYAKDYIAPIDLVDDTDSGKVGWGNAFSTDIGQAVTKASNFGAIARYKNASTFEKDRQYINKDLLPALSGVFPFERTSGYYIQNKQHYDGEPNSVFIPFLGFSYYVPPDIQLGPLPWHQRIGKNENFQLNTYPNSLYMTGTYIPSEGGLTYRDNPSRDQLPMKFLWQSFITWQAYRDVYRTKGIQYNRSSNLSDLTPRGKLDENANNYDVPAARINDGDLLNDRPADMNYYYRPGTDQNFKDVNLLFDRHGLTNEGFPGAKIPYQTPGMGPDYIVCRIATPNSYEQITWYSQKPGLQGQAISPIDASGDLLCWHVLGHRNWVSLGDVTAENGGRKIIVHDALVSNPSDITIQPGVYPS
jgi:hypothetical protein